MSRSNDPQLSIAPTAAAGRVRRMTRPAKQKQRADRKAEEAHAYVGIDVSVVLVDFDGNAIKQTNAPDAEDLTVRDAILLALCKEDPRDPVSGDEKLKNYKLAKRTPLPEEDGEQIAQFTLKEITHIIARSGKALPTVAHGALTEYLEDLSHAADADAEESGDAASNGKGDAALADASAE